MGIYASLFVVRGHVNDTIQSTVYGTDDSDDFWEDVNKHTTGEICQQYEQWACAQGKSE